MGKGIIRITSELLLEHMLLLEGYKLNEAKMDEDIAGVLVLMVEHDSIKNPEGIPLPYILPTYRKVDYELMNVEEVRPTMQIELEYEMTEEEKDFAWKKIKEG